MRSQYREHGRGLRKVEDDFVANSKMHLLYLGDRLQLVEEPNPSKMDTNSTEYKDRGRRFLSGLLESLRRFGLIRFNIDLDCHSQLVIGMADIRAG